MTSTRARRGMVPLACALAVALAGAADAVVPAGAAVVPAGPHNISMVPAGPRDAAMVPAGPRDAAVVPAGPHGIAPAAGAAAAGRQHRIKVLTAVLQNMQKNFSQYRGVTPGPQDILDYQIGSLWKQDIDGYGTTVAVIEGWDYPAIARVVAGFDKTFGLPNPQITTIFPSGPLPAKCPRGMVKLGSYGSCAAWKGELTLDVISAHLIAPYAKIVISATPADSEITDEAAFQVAPPEMMRALEYISANHLANAISISDGTGEVTYSHGAEEITAQDPGELAAAAAGIPVMVATGDCGVVQNLAVANGQCQDTSAAPDTAAWDDSPWVTAVGGSVPNLTATGAKAGPDPVWHTGALSEGAGFSSVFARPAYQNGVAGVTGSPMRSVPDITMDAQDGTSEAAPLFAGVLALATQLNHANVGPVNPALYGALGPAGAAQGIADVIRGNDSAPGVPGFVAAKGFDVASGWGTVNASTFVPGLVAATRASGQESAARHEAAAQLLRLEHSVQLSPGVIPARHSAYLFGTGFLPGHPVVLTIDNIQIATLTASTSGYVTYMIDPAKLGLAPGNHVLQLKSMLITCTRSFTSG